MLARVVVKSDHGFRGDRVLHYYDFIDMRPSSTTTLSSTRARCTQPARRWLGTVLARGLRLRRTVWVLLRWRGSCS